MFLFQGKSKRWLFLFGIGLGILVSFNNCAPPFQEGTPQSLTAPQGSNPLNPPPSGGKSIDQFSATPPPFFKGRAGYAFLLDQYLKPQCAVCHDEAATFTKLPFAGNSLETSYQTALGIPKERLLETVSKNKFCVPAGSCDLSPNGEVYQAISQWLDNRLDN